MQITVLGIAKTRLLATTNCAQNTKIMIITRKECSFFRTRTEGMYEGGER